MCCFEFRKILFLKIRESQLTKISNLYLIEESWANTLEKNEILINNQKKDLLSNISFPEKSPLFINDFSSAINLLKNNKKLKFMCNKEDINKNSNILVFCSNNKLIIDFQKENENKSLLLVDPLNNDNNKKDRIYIISKDYDFYRKILSQTLSFEDSKIKNELIPFEKYINSSSLSNNKLQDDKEKKSIVNFFIYLYYYNEYLLNLKEIYSLKKDTYYLIDYHWLNEFKNKYSFLNIDNFLKETNNFYNKINYNNIDIYYKILTYTYLYHKKIYYKGVSLSIPNDLKNIETIDIMKNLNSANNCFIMPSKIFELIKNLLFPDKKISLNSNEFKIVNNNILWHNKDTCDVIIGHLQNGIFIINFVLKYNTLNICLTEKDLLFKLRINDYINHRKCKNCVFLCQQLKDENNQIIGNIYNLMNKDKQIEINKNLNLEVEENEDEDDGCKTLVGKKVKKLPELDLNQKSMPNQVFSKSNNLFINKLQNKNNLNQNNTNNFNGINNNENYISVINNLKNENKKLKKDYDDSLNEINNLKNKIKLIEQNNNSIINNKNKINEKLKELNNKEEYLNKIEFELGNKVKLYMEEKGAFNIIQFELDEYKIENNNLQSENKSLIEKNKKLENDINEKENQYNELLKKGGKINIMNNNNISKGNEVEQIKKEERKINEAIINHPILSYNFPPLIGLNNIGATCFMNATLQCLSQTKYLTDYFLKESNKDEIINNNITQVNKNNNALSPSYLELINNLWSKKSKQPYSPYEFRRIVEEMNPLFKLGQAGDSKDFIIFVLERMHNELKKPNNKNKVPSEDLNQYDQINAFNHFISEFQKKKSIISNIFFGIVETTNICQNCKNNHLSQGLNIPICYNYQSFNCLIFPLEEIRKMKVNNMNKMNMNYSQNININTVDIYDCFNFYEKIDYFTGVNQNYCNLCNRKADSTYKCKIYLSPDVLFFILNRGKDNIYNVKIDFIEKIDLSQYVIKKEGNQLIFELYGVITLLGQSGPSAHFVASCKSPVDQKWYRYNDDLVSPISDFQNEVIDFGTPYILFYKKFKL